jgi:hypothetical protein
LTFKLASQNDSCRQTKIYFSDGKVEYEGCVKNGKKEGLWKEYSSYENHYFVRFIWTFRNGLKDGPYQALGEAGIVEARGNYKLGSLSDTLNAYNDEGKLTDYEVWKPSGNFGTSNRVSQNILIKPEHPDNYHETINDKTYTWMSGRRYEIKQEGSDRSSAINNSRNVVLVIPWEGFDPSSSVGNVKITTDNLQGIWKTIKGVYKDGKYNLPLDFTTPINLEFSKNSVKRSVNDKFTKFTLLNNVLTIKYEYETEIGIINKITPSELIITWKSNGNYTRYFYTR